MVPGLRNILLSIYRLWVPRRPALVGIFGLLAIYAGMGQTGGHPLLILSKIALLSGFGAVMGTWVSRRVTPRTWRVLRFALPILWFLPVGQILGGWVPPLQGIWALGVWVLFALTFLRATMKRSLVVGDVKGFLSRVGWGFALLISAALALALVFS